MRQLFALVLLAESACFSGDPFPTECSDEEGQECPGGSICREYVCRKVCNASRDCESATDACLSSACMPYSQSCSSDVECTDGFFCDLGACRKYPADPSCDDNVRDGAETDVDCGGPDCAGCGTGDRCDIGADCESGVCTGELCAAPTCSDGAINGAETGMNCGGAACPACAAGEGCDREADCISLVCTEGSCVLEACADGVRNGPETDIDCGGGCSGCGTGRDCLAPDDCASRVCTASLCEAPTCTDLVRNGSETHADCGGPDCPACADGAQCLAPSDCASSVCSGGTCAPPVCTDLAHNGNESDIDCGGGTCPDCEPGFACTDPSDCVSNVCLIDECAAAGCTDTVLNGDETDIDCGGSCPGCATGGDCVDGNDCADGVCTNRLCAAPTCTDAIRNGTETHLDCGGAACAPCGDGQGCTLPRDCVSGVCTSSLCQAPACTDGVRNGSEGDVDCGGSCVRCTALADCSTGNDCESGICGAGTCTSRVINAGSLHSCAVVSGTARCWGNGGNGRLGYGNTNHIGDGAGEMPPASVSVSGVVLQVSAGEAHSCALLSTSRAIKCWGQGLDGRLGYGSALTIGDAGGEMPPADINVGGRVMQMSAGGEHTCALLESGDVRCWGNNGYGQLGYGHTNSLGDGSGEMPPNSVNVGGRVLQIEAGRFYTCALLEGGLVRCWGEAFDGQMLNGNIFANRGDAVGEMPPPNMNIGGQAVHVAAGDSHICVALITGSVRCWGSGAVGKLGNASNESVGDDPGETSAFDVAVGGRAIQVTAGSNHTCALLETGGVRCWGSGGSGRLGYGDTNHRGDAPGEMPTPDVSLGGQAVYVTAGGAHTCALLSTGSVVCWGSSANGQPGYGDTNNVGDVAGEMPPEAVVLQ